MNKKGQIKLNKTIEVALILILTVVILFSLYSALIPEVQTAGDALNDSNYCVSQGCFYNASLLDESPAVDNPCRQENASNSSNACGVAHTLPIASIFRSGGIIVLLLMVTLILVIIKTVMPKGKK